MKKIISILVVFIMLLPSFVMANPNNSIVEMEMDGKVIGFNTVGLEVQGKVESIDVPAVIHEGRALVPLHIIKNMNIKVEWKEATREVSIITADKTIVMQIDSPIAIINGEAKRLPSDVPPKIITYRNAGRTMVPIAFLRELDLIVNWHEDTRTVSVEAPKEVVVIVETPISGKEVKDITVDILESSSEVRISTGEKIDFTRFQLNNPERLVVDLQDTRFSLRDKNKLLSNGTLHSGIDRNGIKSVKASQFQVNPYVTRVVVELEEMKPYEVFYDENTQEMVIRLEGHEVIEEGFNYREVTRGSSRLELRGSDVTQYDFAVSDYGKTLHITVPKAYIELPMMNIEINDLMLESINIGEDLEGDNYHMEIRLNESANYRGLSPSNTKNYIMEFTRGYGDLVPKDGILIVIDPGHGGTDPGTTSSINGLVEKELTLDISQRLNKLLIENGYSTYLTRTADTTVALLSRAEIANQLNADLFISIHANSADRQDAATKKIIFNPTPYGVENYYHPNNENLIKHNNSMEIAKILQKEMVAATGTYDRGVKTANYAVLRETSMPSVLSEIGFLSNPEEAARFMTTEYRQLVAEAIYQSIVKYFGTVLQ